MLCYIPQLPKIINHDIVSFRTHVMERISDCEIVVDVLFIEKVYSQYDDIIPAWVLYNPVTIIVTRKSNADIKRYIFIIV